MIDASILVNVYGIRHSMASIWVPYINEGMELCEANTILRKAAFLAQIGHESGCLKYTREIWGPTKQQLKYEIPTQLAKRLGNIYPGDGKRYMGRGLIQTTGRANYALTYIKLKNELGSSVPNFEDRPALLQEKLWAALSAGLFWKVKNLNRYADSGDFYTLTKRINGGTNGLLHRQHLFIQALGNIT